jgi:hypothetical protein
VVVKAPPLHELHREEPLPAVGKQLVERYQVGVRDVGERAELVLEPIERFLAGVAQRLQSHRRAALLVESLVDDTERARTQPTTKHKPLRAVEGVFGRVRYTQGDSAFGRGVRFANRRPRDSSRTGALDTPCLAPSLMASSGRRSRRRASH